MGCPRPATFTVSWACPERLLGVAALVGRRRAGPSSARCGRSPRLAASARAEDGPALSNLPTKPATPAASAVLGKYLYPELGTVS
jgi:hypothetical protein